MCRCHLVSHKIGILHVQIAIPVIAHEHYRVLPRTAVAVLGVVDGLVHHYLRLRIAHYGETSHADVEFVDIHRFQTFAVVEHSMEAVVDVADTTVV